MRFRIRSRDREMGRLTLDDDDRNRARLYGEGQEIKRMTLNLVWSGGVKLGIRIKGV